MGFALECNNLPAGFQSPAQDYIEQVVDLAGLLDLRAPSVYAVRYRGAGFSEQAIIDRDILIVDAAIPPYHGAVAIAFENGEVRLIMLHRATEGWRLTRAGHADEQKLTDDLDVWGIVTGMVREVAP